MTVETITGGGDPVTKSGPYNGNGATSVFDYDFQIQDETELLVTRLNALGTEDILTLTTDYTVSGVGVDAGGQITLVAPATSLPTGAQLVIQYDGDYNQSSDYSSQGGINLEELEDALDKITMHLRGLKELADRSVKVDAFGVSDLDELQANLRSLAAIEAAITTVAGISTAVSAVAAIDTDVSAVAAISADVAAVADIVADVTAVADIDTDVSAVAAINTAVAAVALITSAVSTVANIDTEIAALAAITTAISDLAAIDEDVSRVADIYQGALASDPTTRLDGSALEVGDFYLNTGTGSLTFLQSTGPAVWVAVGALVKATQLQAEAGTENTTYMTPLRTKQAIDEFASGGWSFETQATTSGTEFDFAIGAGAKEIVVIFNEPTLSGSDHFLVQLENSGGLVTSGYKSICALIGASNASSTAGHVHGGFGSTRENISKMTLMPEGSDWVSDVRGLEHTSNRGVLGSGKGPLTGDVTNVRVTRDGTDTFSGGSITVGWRK